MSYSYVAARRTRSAEQFYTAGRSITGFQNGLALAGDYMSTASFLGIARLAALSGFDGLICFTTRAAQASMLTGTGASLLLIYLSPTIQIDILGNDAGIFPLRNPGLISIPLSFAVAIGVALLWPEPAAAGRVRRG